MTIDLKLTVDNEGFWLAKAPCHTGEITTTPGEAVETLLANMGIEMRRDARIINARIIED